MLRPGINPRCPQHDYGRQPEIACHGERLEPHDELLKANRSLQIEELPMVALIDDMAKKIMKNGLQTGAFVGSTLNFVDISTNSMSIER